MLTLFILVLAVLIVGSLAYGAVSAAPWVPMWPKDIRRLIEFAGAKPGEIIYDLGCGDGRMVRIAAKEYGLQAIGLEIALLPYLLARLRIWHVGPKARIKLRDFWSVDLGKADIVACFLTPPVMSRLADKLAHELKPGARFVSYAFPLPGQVPSAVSKPSADVGSIYLYTNIVRPVGKRVDI